MLKPEFTAELKDGTEVQILTVDPCDKKCIADGFDRLSARSRQLRFFSTIKKLSDVQLTYLTNVDNVNHVVITANETTGEGRTGIGLARYIRLTDEPDIAEFAISVTDDYQGLGVGSILLDILIEHAKGNSISVLRGYVLRSNQPMIKLLERHDAKRFDDENDAFRFDLHINV